MYFSKIKVACFWWSRLLLILHYHQLYSQPDRLRSAITSIITIHMVLFRKTPYFLQFANSSWAFFWAIQMIQYIQKPGWQTQHLNLGLKTRKNNTNWPSKSTIHTSFRRWESHVVRGIFSSACQFYEHMAAGFFGVFVLQFYGVCVGWARCGCTVARVWCMFMTIYHTNACQHLQTFVNHL